MQTIIERQIKWKYIFKSVLSNVKSLSIKLIKINNEYTIPTIIEIKDNGAHILPINGDTIIPKATYGIKDAAVIDKFLI